MKETQPTQPVLREPVEVQRAHDMLAQLVLNDELFKHIVEDESDRQAVMAAMDTLCWLLGHHHNQVFAKNMTYIEAAMAEEGYVLENLGQLFWPPEAS